MLKLTIAIPVFNEAENIAKEIQELENKLQEEHIINIIYDFDEDNTLPIVLKEKEKYKTQINLIKNKYGRGALNAIKTGLESAETEYVIVTMADLSDPPDVMNNMVKCAEEKQSDIVCASRYMKGGKQIGGPFIKGLMSRCASLSLHYLTGIKTHDGTNSFKLYRTSFLKEQIIESNGGFELGLELVVKAHLSNKKIDEVPTVWTDRTNGKSNFKIIEWLPSYLKWYFKAFRRKSNG